MRDMVYTFDQLKEVHWRKAGGKGGTLAKLYQMGYKVPEGFVILPEAFIDDNFNEESWLQTLNLIDNFRSRYKNVFFAIRSSGFSEDSAEASYAGEYETILNATSNEEVYQGILKVVESRKSSRVEAYSKAQNLDSSSQIAVVIQKMLKPQTSGVLFTVNPINGYHGCMLGNYVDGLGEALVSGESDGKEFKILRDKGQYIGPKELRRFHRGLFKMGEDIERELGCPQDIEWAIEDGQLYLLQSRPITTLRDYDPVMGQWNDTLKGDYLWSSCNASEALPDVMTPLSWSVWEVFHEKTYTIKLPKGFSLQGNIGGRSYFNYSVFYWLMGTIMNPKNALMKTEEALGLLPKGVDIPKVKFSGLDILQLFHSSLKWEMKYRRLKREIPDYVNTNISICQNLKNKIISVSTREELSHLWKTHLEAYMNKSFNMLRAATKPAFDLLPKLKLKLTSMVEESTANILLSNLGKDGLESLGPVAGIGRVAAGEEDMDSFIMKYGHRGPHEAELSIPRPGEDTQWIAGQLKEYREGNIDVEGLISKKNNLFEAAITNLRKTSPNRAEGIINQIAEAARAAKVREAVRSEVIRYISLIRSFCIKAGEITGLGDDIFYLTIDEIIDYLMDDDSSKKYIPTRKRNYKLFSSLPVYPVFIKGEFDPIKWGQDPLRRRDVYSSDLRTSVDIEDTIKGFAGSSGRVEGVVRIIERPEEGHLLRVGEILVTNTTNIGWTPIFPKAAAIVTDVGAPLSHAAIVARELGIPAVVGCRNATMLLKTGDRIIVDGGSGLIEILSKDIKN